LLSLPVRERGLKYRNRPGTSGHRLSLPVRERGLKCVVLVSWHGKINVAPRAGAWIEIRNSRNNYASSKSLPVRERGLKSEQCERFFKILLTSLPVRERGLKYVERRQTYRRYRVAPRAGAWIEMLSC